MAQPVWVTPAGALTLPTPITLSASPVSPAVSVTYTLITGLLPTGLSLSTAGVISGTPPTVLVSTTYRFTVRATDDLGDFRDRSFNLTLSPVSAPQFTLPAFSNLFVTPDSTWTTFQVAYTYSGSDTVFVIVSAGALPPGLEIDSSGLIRGYAAAVTADAVSQFTLTLLTSGGLSTSTTYSITISNNLSKYPAILNNRPSSFVPAPSDPYAGYYLPTETTTFTASISTLTTGSFIGYISGTTLTVTAIITAEPQVGQIITGTGVTTGSTIISITTPAASYAIQSIASTATDFTVTLFSIPATWVPGTLVTIEGASVAAYNADWFISSIGVITFTVTSALNPGVCLDGTARSYGTNIDGLYTLNASQTVGSSGSPVSFQSFRSELNVTSVASGNLYVGTSFSGTAATATAAGSFIIGQPYVIDTVGTTVWTTIGATAATFDGSVTGYTLTVTGGVVGVLAPGQEITGVATAATPSGQLIVGQTYTIAVVGTTDWVALGAASSTPGVVFTATGTGYVQAGSLVPGFQYIIKVVGSTDFTTVGAAVNNPGTVFTATGVGSGSGYCAQGSGTAYATIASGTTIIGYGTGTGGTGTYTVDVSSSYQTITGVGWTAAPTVGHRFTATGAGAGTGTAKPYVPDGTLITAYGTGSGSTGTYAINQQLTVPSTTLTGSTTVGTALWGEYFSFKLIGVDWNTPTRPLIYSAIGLPAGLTLDPTTGWISGYVTQPAGITLQTYTFLAWVVNDLGYSSPNYTFSITMSSGVGNTVTWTTSSDLGTIDNGSESTFSVVAQAATPLQYRLVGGSLPPALYLQPDGQIVGVIAWQPAASTTPVGTTLPFNFTVESYDPLNPVLRASQRDFKISVYQRWSTPVETVYIKCTPPADDRALLATLLNSTVIPDNMLYRSGDPNWGRATDVIYDHAYGVPSSTASEYTGALSKNFYNRSVTLGEIKTAVARDGVGNIIYEVVYSAIIDDLNNTTGTSVSKTITWPYTVTTSNGATTNTLYPASLHNMQEQLWEVLGRNSSETLLPKWMTSQQLNGSTLGYTRAWVIAYTKPGFSATVVERIRTLWPHTLNLINFGIDRIMANKSATYNYSGGNWSTIPSGTALPCNIVATCAPGSQPNEITAQLPTATNNITYWYPGMAIRFTGTPFGGILNDVTYYITTINLATNTFTISASPNIQTEVLYTAVGLMTGVPVYPTALPTDSQDIFVLFDRPNILSRP